MINDTIIVAIEGIDRVGKSTSAKNLTKKLSDSVVQKIPYKDGITYERIYKMLENGEALKLSYFFQFLMSMNRLLWQRQQLPILSTYNKWIILDRWHLSARVYGEITGVSENDMKIISEGIIEPDFYFLFDGEPFEMSKEKDSYENDLELQKRVRDLYLEKTEKMSNVCVIESNQPVDAITEQLYNKCMELERNLKNGKK